MADFQVSLRDSNEVLQVELSASGNALQITDQSNYTDGTDSGHDEADFATFRRILLTRPDGTTYNLSSIGDGDGTIVAGDSVTTDNYTVLDTDEDGLWVIKLTSVPDYDAADTYDLNDNVYYNSKFYKSLQGSNSGNTPGSSPAYWEEITESNLNSKYVIEERFALQALEIYPGMSSKLNDWVEDAERGLCQQSKYRKQVQDLIAYDTALQYLLDRRAFSKAENVLNAMLSICRC